MKNSTHLSNLRAIAILIVVLGHSIILYSSSWNLYESRYNIPILDFTKNCINVIQMPLFISLSGYLYHYSHNKLNFFELVKKKAKRIVLPYFAFSVFWMIPIKKFASFAPYQKNIFELFWSCVILERDIGHMWFLPFLFCSFILTCLLLKFEFQVFHISEMEANIFNLFVGIAINLFGNHLPSFPGRVLFGNIATWWLWFLYGMLLALFMSKHNFSWRYPWIVAILSLFILLWSAHTNSMVMIVRFVVLFVLFSIRTEKTTKFLNLLSQNSFGIYLIHSPLIYLTFSHFLNANPALVVFVNFFLFGGIALVLTILLRRAGLSVLIGESEVK